MKRDQIERVIDKKVDDLYEQNYSNDDIIKELCKSKNNMTKVLEKSGSSFDDFENMDFDAITPLKTRYLVQYIKHCNHNINNVNWIDKNRYKFLLDDNKIFKLLKLKNKLKNSII